MAVEWLRYSFFEILYIHLAKRWSEVFSDSALSNLSADVTCLFICNKSRRLLLKLCLTKGAVGKIISPLDTAVVHWMCTKNKSVQETHLQITI